jgi:hypothetical protein
VSSDLALDASTAALLTLARYRFSNPTHDKLKAAPGANLGGFFARATLPPTRSTRRADGGGNARES